MAGETQHGFRRYDGAGFGGSEVVLPDMESRAEEGGHVGAVVDDESRLTRAAECGDAARFFEQGAAPVALVAELQDARAAIQPGFRGALEGTIARGQALAIEDRIDGR